MIHAVLVFNNFGKPRLMKFYTYLPEAKQQQILAETFHMVSQKPAESCNFLERPGFMGEGCDCKIMYRHFTTLYFVFCCDASESELAILDLIQVYVEALDKSFKNVCELDLIFHVDRAHYILNEIIMGGVVLDTDIYEVIRTYEEQVDQELKETRLAPVLAMSDIHAKLADHLPSLSLRNIKIPDISFNMRELGGN